MTRTYLADLDGFALLVLRAGLLKRLHCCMARCIHRFFIICTKHDALTKHVWLGRSSSSFFSFLVALLTAPQAQYKLLY